MASTATATTRMTPPLSTPGYSVQGRVFVITGGTQGLGLGIARQLAQQGAKGLVLVSRNQAKGDSVCRQEEEQSQQKTKDNNDTNVCIWRFVAADLGDAPQAQDVIPKAVTLMKDVGPISGVVNAAAITERGNLMTTTAEGFDVQMAINVRAPFLITQATAKHMKEHSCRGSIVNISSVAADGGAPFIMAYSASKAALNVLTKNNAAELAPHGIRVNAISMGWTVTENEHKLQTANMGEDWVAQADAGVPLGRILRPEDVAATVGFLLSDSSALMTGSILNLHPEFPEGMLSVQTEDKR